MHFTGFIISWDFTDSQMFENKSRLLKLANKDIFIEIFPWLVLFSYFQVFILASGLDGTSWFL